MIYDQDNSYRESAGQGVTFTLTMTDGTQTDIMAYAPFLVTDGVGYKTKYEPCEALKPGGNIYEVTARWNTQSGYGGGTASYSFYVGLIQ